MKNILIALLVMIIIGQSFSLHKCRCEAIYQFYHRGKHTSTFKTKNLFFMQQQIPVDAFNGNTGKRFKYDSVTVTLNP